MAADAVSELVTLQAVLSASQRKRQSGAADHAPAGDETPGEPPPRSQPAADGSQAEKEARDFADLLREFVEDAEHNVVEHPEVSVVGALLIGILIGRLSARR